MTRPLDPQRPPTGSRIQIEQSADRTAITVPYRRSGYGKSITGTFLLFWLGGWAVGFADAFKKIASGNAPPFLVFWLAAWTLGGGYAAYLLFRLIRPAIPERFELREAGWSYDSGRPNFEYPLTMQGQLSFWNEIFQKRIRAEFPRSTIATLRLRDAELRNRLTVDCGAERIEFAKGASDVEREWLYQVLKMRYDAENA